MKTKVTEEMKSQWRKWMGYLYDYLPTKYEANQREWAVRRFVWNFKDGKQSLDAAKLVAQRLVKQFGSECGNLTFVCVPASSGDKNEARYHAFSDEVCRLTGCKNAFSAIGIDGSRLAIHEHHNQKRLTDTQVISFDTDFFKGQRCIVFDDIITRGHSYAKFACKLESFGATVVGALFLARTINF